MSWDAVSALAEVAGAVATVPTLAFLASQIRNDAAAVRGPVSNRKADSWAAARRSLSVVSVPERVARLLNEAQRRD
jgi:hypothetical protein